jgi:hypothetical protein
MPEPVRIANFLLHASTIASVEVSSVEGTPSGKPADATPPARRGRAQRQTGDDQVDAQPSSVPAGEPESARVYLRAIDELQEAHLLKALNARADEIANQIEIALRRKLPPQPFLSVHATVTFQPGSIEIFIPLAVTWLGNIVLGETNRRIEQLAAGIVERVLNVAMQEVGQAFEYLMTPVRVQSMPGMDEDAPIPPASAAIRAPIQQPTLAPTGTATSVGQMPAQDEVSSQIEEKVRKLTWAVMVLGALITLLLLSQFFEPRDRTERTTASVESPQP